MVSNKTFFLVILFVSSFFLFFAFSWSGNLARERIVYTEKECNCDDKQNLRKSAHVQNTTTTTRPTTKKLTTTPRTIKQTPNPQAAVEQRWKEIALQYHTYINTVQVKCNTIVRMGSTGDGGWDICDDDKYRPKQPCLIYSFGINNDWTFDDAVSKKYGCHVHAFDPSMKQNDHNRSAIVHFHKLGIGDRKYITPMGWHLDTLAGIRQQLGHSKIRLQILKMDTEKAELSSIPEMIRSGALDDVTQFVFEIHLRMNARDEPEPDIKKYEMGLNLLSQIYKAGFRIFKTHQNAFSRYVSKFGPTRSGCHELNLIRPN